MKQPNGIDLDQYKTQAKDLLKQIRGGQSSSLERLHQHHPERPAKVKLSDAQLVIARENGFPSWPKFKNDLIFRNAVQAMADGDIQTLERLLDEHPFLIRYRAHFGEPYERGYFSGATLLNHIAGNPDIHPIPHNIVDIAKLLLSRGFDKERAQYTIGLLLTSRQASETRMALPLIDLLTEAGAGFDLQQEDLLNAPLLNVAPETASGLVARGARMKLRHAAGLGRVQDMQSLLEKGASQDELDLALVFASIRGQKQGVDLLLQHGAKGDVLLSYGPQPRTAIHEAANRGRTEIVKALVAAGASNSVLDAQWNGTPADWAEVGGFPELAAYLRNL